MTLQQILFVMLCAATVVLATVLFVQGRRRRTKRRSPYVEALYALIDGRRGDALNLLTRAVRNGETDPDAYLQLGNLLRERRQPDKALQIHRGLAVRRDLVFEEEKAVQIAIAEDLAALGKLDRAVQTLEAVMKRRKDPEIVRALHAACHRAGNHDRAFAMLRELAKTDPSIDRKARAGYLAAVASERAAAGDADEARRLVDRARREFGESVPALWIAGRIALEAGDTRGAIDAWKILLRVDPGSFREILPLLEKALFDSGRFEELGKVLQDLVSRHPGHPGIVAALAAFREKKGEADEAIRILEDDPDVARDPVAGTRLALLYLDSGRTSDLRALLAGLNGAVRSPIEWRCASCGAFASVPHTYCTACSGIGTFVRHEDDDMA